MYLSQVTYCGGYSGVEPPLPIPNREVKRTSADGTAPPGGRVGRCRFSEAPSPKDSGLLLLWPGGHNRTPKSGSALPGLHERGGGPPRAPLRRFAPSYISREV